MNAERLARVGIPYVTTRSDGTGLGIVLARAAIIQHGGQLNYDSEAGVGTTVTIVLPRIIEEQRH